MFARWRYFEDSAADNKARNDGKDDENPIMALVNAERAGNLGKSARVIADECVVAGLSYKGDFKAVIRTEHTLGFSSQADTSATREVYLALQGNEPAIPWDEVLRSQLRAVDAG